MPFEKAKDLFCCEVGYQTPKMDCRAAIIEMCIRDRLMAMSLMLSTLKQMPKQATFASMNLSGGETGICADVGSLNGIEYPDFTKETLSLIHI